MTQTLPRGRAAGRLLRSLALAQGNPEAAAAFIAGQGWADGDLIRRSAVSALEASGTHGLAGYAQQDFIDLVRPLSLVGRLTLARRGSVRLPTLVQTGGITAAWTAESKAVPMGVPTVQRLTAMDKFKCSALTVVSNEALREEGLEAELARDLAAACAAAADLAMIDGAAGDTQRPASVGYGAATSAASGDAATDVETALSNFGGDPLTAVWMTSPVTAAAIGAQLGDPALGVAGGRLAGIPLLTSTVFAHDSSGGSTLILLDQRALQVAAFEGATLSTSQAAMIEQDTGATGATDSPTAASLYLTSMFQEDCTALLGSLPIAWRLVRADAVFVLTGCTYARFAA